MSRAPLRILPTLALCAGLWALPAGAEELGQVRFTFDGVEKTWYTVLRIIKGKAGTFSAEFCHATGISGKPDEASCRLVSGTIDTKVVRKD